MNSGSGFLFAAIAVLVVLIVNAAGESPTFAVDNARHRVELAEAELEQVRDTHHDESRAVATARDQLADAKAGLDAELTRQDARRQVDIAKAERDAQQARLEAQQQAAEARQAARWRSARAAASNIALALLTLAPIVGLLLGGLWLWNRRGLIHPRRADATLPFRIASLTVDDAREALAHRAERELAEAQRPILPETLHYAPHFRNQQDIQGLEPAALPAVSAPAFTQMPLRVESVVLGHDGHDLVTRPWTDLQSLAIGGLTGSGKTWTAVSLVLQALHAGHRVALVDPHADDVESLAGRLTPVHRALWRPVAVTPAEASATLEAVGRLIIDRGQGGDRDRTPTTLVVDEFTRMMRGKQAEDLANILEGVVSEGRKLAVRVVMLGQRWSASRTGGSGDLRDVVPHVLLHRMRRNDARMLSGWPNDELPDCTKLEPGECYLLEGDDVVRVVQPRMSAQDVAAFARALPMGQVGSGYGPGTGEMADVGETLAPTQPVPSPNGDHMGDHTPAAIRERILAYFNAGDSIAEITDALTDKASRAGSKWKLARQQVEQTLREELTRS